MIDAGLKLLIIPLATRLLGIEQYGVWLTANALLSLLMVSDFGIGSGVINAVSGAMARNEIASARAFLATAYLMFGVLAVYVAGSVILLSRSSLLPKWLGIEGHPNLVADSRHLFMIMGLLISTAAFLNVINFFVSSLQEGYLAHCAQIAASVTALICILNLHTHSMSRFAVATALPIVSAYVLLSFYVFGVRHRSLRPAFTKVRMSSFRVIWKDGSRLLIAQIADTVLAFMSSVLVASHLGASHVPEVSVSLQVMMIVNYVACMFILPLWPAYVEAGQRGDHDWIALAFRRGALRSMACVALATAVYFLIYRQFIHRWSPVLPVPSRTFVLALCVWFLVYVWNKNPMVLINALGFTEVRAWVASLAAFSFVTSAWLLMPRLGVVAIPVAGCISALLEACFTTTKALTLLSNHKLHARVATEADIAI
jgi:O-antigen/teichoic acid export membrane protein